jgi:hypothetical protein
MKKRRPREGLASLGKKLKNSPTHDLIFFPPNELEQFARKRILARN